MAVKISTSEAAVWAAGDLMQLLGGRGYMENNIAPQMLRDARVLTVGEGPNETLNWYLGRSAIQTDVVQRFVAEEMAFPDLAARLNDDCREIQARCTGSNAHFLGAIRRSILGLLPGRRNRVRRSLARGCS